MLVIGLTGGIGSGKSTIANLFAERNVPIIDADKIAHEITECDQPAYEKIVAHFGTNILATDNSLNRKKLRTIIFEDAREKHWVEQLLHPLIRESIIMAIKKISAPYCIAVIPLLIEAEFYPFINRILVVDADPDLQVKRVVIRDKVTPTHVKAILKSQISREHRAMRAHDVINNDGKREDLIPQVERLHQMYLKMSIT